MTYRVDNILVITEEKNRTCSLCGKEDECRPYGPDFKDICFDCAMKDPVGTEIRMHKKMFGGDLTIEQATRYIEIRKIMNRAHKN